MNFIMLIICYFKRELFRRTATWRGLGSGTACLS